MKKTTNDYTNKINELKHNAKNNNILFIELNANDLMLILEDSANVKVASQAMYDMLLEGDIIQEGRVGLKIFKVRYYCDNLDPSRKNYKDVM